MDYAAPTYLVFDKIDNQIHELVRPRKYALAIENGKKVE